MDVDEAMHRFRGPLMGLILSWGVPSVDAFELAQDSLADALLTRDLCRGDASQPDAFGRWLRGVAKNKVRNWRRSRSRREQRVRIVSPDCLVETPNASTTVDPRIERLRMEIERLPRKQREVVMMHYLEETSVNDVAAILSVTSKAVEGRLYQARRRLRERMNAAPASVQLLKAILL